MGSTANIIRIGPGDPPEYIWLYTIPGLLFAGCFILAAKAGVGSLVEAGYLTSSVLCISSFPSVFRY